MEFINELPADVLSKIASYRIGEPKYMKFKYNNALKQIQQKYKPRTYGLETNMNCRRDNIFESINFEIETKVKGKTYVLDLILKQTEYIKKIINQSHLMYIQPDMEKILFIKLECDEDHYNNFFYAEWQTNMNNIQEALNEIHKTMSDMMDDFCENEYEIVRLNKLYFTIQIIV